MTAVRSAESSTAGQGADALRVLVVEDDHEAAERLAGMLAECHCRVQAFHAGSEAIARVGEFQPHLAVISLSLPDMRGFEVAHRLCECAETRRVLLISLSTQDQESERRLANALGFDFHLVKPVDADEFRRDLLQIARDYGLPCGAGSSAAPEGARSGEGISWHDGGEPAAEACAAALRETAWAWSRASLAKSRNSLRVLLVDQGREAAGNLAHWLRRWGYEVKVCLGADQALEEVDAFAPHVIVVETEGLDVDACALAAALKDRARAAQPRLIALVAPGRERTVCCPATSDFDLHLSGPAAVQRLGEALGELLSIDARFE